MQLRVKPGLLGPAWHLDTVEVRHGTKDATTLFVFRKWIDKKSGWSHTLTTDSQHQELVAYYITVHTSDVRGAGPLLSDFGFQSLLLVCCS
jgi:hypothetical protein